MHGAERREARREEPRHPTHLVVTLVEAGQCSGRRMQRRTRGTVKAFQYGRHGESDHGPAARLMHLLYFLRVAVKTRRSRASKEIGGEKEGRGKGRRREG